MKEISWRKFALIKKQFFLFLLLGRQEESKDAGGNFYERVYETERPEVFFKATPHRAVGPNQSAN